jgi:hypothetical protein
MRTVGLGGSSDHIIATVGTENLIINTATGLCPDTKRTATNMTNTGTDVQENTIPGSIVPINAGIIRDNIINGDHTTTENSITVENNTTTKNNMATKGNTSNVNLTASTNRTAINAKVNETANAVGATTTQVRVIKSLTTSVNTKANNQE